MGMRMVLLLVWIGVGVGGSLSEGVEEVVLQKPEEAGKEEKVTDRSEQLWKKCFHKFTPWCVKHALFKVVRHLQDAGLQIAPGITLQTNSSHTSDLHEMLKDILGADPSNTSGMHVLHKLKEFLSGLSVKVELEDPGLLKKVQVLTEEVVDSLVTSEETEGRKKGGGGALLWSAGALAAVGFASLAAVAGKAMMASLMALMLAGLSAMRGQGGGGGGGGHKSSHVEIIKAPAHIELAPAHYEGTHAFEHDHYYSAPGYEYGRKMSDGRPTSNTLTQDYSP